MLERDTLRRDQGLVDWGKTDKTRHAHAVLYVEHVQWRRLLWSFTRYAAACFLIQLVTYVALTWPLARMIDSQRTPDRILSDLYLALFYYTQLDSPWQLLIFCGRFAVCGTVIFVVVSVFTHVINRPRAEIDSYARLVAKSWPLMLALMPGVLPMLVSPDDYGSMLNTASDFVSRVAGSLFAYRYFAVVRQSYNVGIARGMITVFIIGAAYIIVMLGLYIFTAF